MPTTRKTWKTGTTRRYMTKTHKWHYRTSGHSNWPSTTYNPQQYNQYRKEIQAKIGSYRTINQQFSGTGKVMAFSPTGANKWIKYVNQGAWVYKFNSTQFSRWFGSNWSTTTPTAAFRYLKKKYGSGIKAVTRGKGNNWLVAATPKVNARPFSNYPWK